MDAQKIKKIVLELSSEDAHGSWELWSASSQGLDRQEIVRVRELFQQVIGDLVVANKLVVFKKKPENGFVPTLLEPAKLAEELKRVDHPDPNTFYWFASTEFGAREDLANRSRR